MKRAARRFLTDDLSARTERQLVDALHVALGDADDVVQGTVGARSPGPRFKRAYLMKLRRGGCGFASVATLSGEKLRHPTSIGGSWWGKQELVAIVASFGQVEMEEKQELAVSEVPFARKRGRGFRLRP